VHISLDEQLISMQEARTRLPGHPDLSTLFRWRQKGVRGVRLDTIVCGGRRFTSVEALERFVSASTVAASTGDQAHNLPDRSRQIAAADAACRAAGI